MSLRQRCAALGIPYVTRAGWGARLPRARFPLSFGPLGFVTHHSVTATAPEPAQMQAIQAFHMDAKGWTDFGYSVGVGQSGAIYEGRSCESLDHGMLARSGGTGDPEDAYLLSVCAIGNFHTVSHPSRELKRSFGVVAGWLAEEHGAPRQFGDRDFNLTACCGDNLYPFVPFPPVSPSPEPPEPPAPPTIKEPPMSALIHKPKTPGDRGWYLRDDDGTMILVDGSVNGLDDAYPRVGQIQPDEWNRLVAKDAKARARLGLGDDGAPDPV